MKQMQKNIVFTVIVGVFLVVGFLMITKAITKYTGFSIGDEDENDFEKCLSEQEIVLYINSEDIVKTLKGIELYDYLTKIKIFNCLENNNVCLENGINSFPSWIVNGEKIERDISIEELINFTGCNPIK